ncbi:MULTISPECIES: signal recognition particle-docking protein FtsY [Bifidobacterium]|uniref:signal recognition particle-docking protein FtsY n=1 Tax=Bifidobacterium TaxID=1678 RepID=UPI0018DEA841|nr:MULTISPECIES: signal recognition particle-docking protein FtsY [Bifidobacterium]MBH9979962.1 signal recognition particle-docking protein FtsY [Bifidobacterium asteroides]MBI0099569.1 signal recognition particle-docking protein FtsY [Bifidobacterium sp. W8114]
MTTQQILILIAVLIVLVLAVVGILVAVRKRRFQGDSARSGRAEEPGDGRSSLSPKSAASAAKSQAESRPGASRKSSSDGQAIQSASSASDASSNPGAPKGSAGSVASEASSQSSSADQEALSAQEELAHPEASASRMTRLKARLAKSPNPFGKALFAILTKDHLSESDWEDVEDTLLMADVGAEASEQLVKQLRDDARITGQKDPAAVRRGLRQRLIDLVDPNMDRTLVAARPQANRPSVIIMVGVNGTGKTTTAGKLARLFVADGKSVVMGAADTFRAAAADQLETWGGKVGVPVVRSDRDGADPASVAFEAAERAKNDQADVLIVDTAGRLQNKANLMDQLGKIRRVIEKNLPVDEVLLVLDATTGQNGMIQAQVFAQAIGVTGIVLTKLDGSAKGGIVISVQRELGVPVKLVGLGEGPDDLAVFDPESFVDGILGDE